MKICVKCGSKEYTAEGSEHGDILTCMNCGSNDFSVTPITATYQQFLIKASYKGTKKAEWSDSRYQNFNNHMITVTNTETGEKARFEFWASIAHPVLTKEYDILNAFYCFVSDAVSGSESFDYFCSEFGYNTDSRSAEKIYRKCKKQLEKLNKIYNGDLYELLGNLSEIAG